VVVDEARSHVEARRVDHLVGIGRVELPDRGDDPALDPDVGPHTRSALSVEDGAAFDDGRELGHGRVHLSLPPQARGLVRRRPGTSDRY
jgi:hypothetical protein